MSALLLIVVPLALGAVVVTLDLGLVNMARGGSSQSSQAYMRWRVALQFAALIVIMAALYFSTG